MQINPPKKRSSFSLIKYWIFSYVCVLLLPIILCIVYGLYTCESLKTQQINDIYDKLITKTQSADDYLLDITSHFSKFYLDENVYKLQSLTPETYKPASRLYYPAIQTNIKEITSFQGKLSNIILYFPNINVMVDKNTHITIDLASEISAPMIDPSLLKQLTMALDSDPISNIAYLTWNNNLYIGQRIHTNRLGEATSYIIYHIDVAFLLTHLATDVEEISLYLVYPDGLLTAEPNTLQLTNSDKDILISKIALSCLKEMPVPLTEYKDGYFLCARSSIHLKDFNYVYVIAKNAYDKALTSMVTFFFVIMLFSIVVESLLINFFIKKNYRPVKEIVSHISPNETAFGNEYSIILNAIKRNSSELKHQQEALKNNYLLKMLAGEISYEESLSNQSRFHPTIKGNFLCVSLIELAENHANNRDLYLFIIKNIISELLCSYGYNVLFGTFQSSIAVIISCDTHENHTMEDIYKHHQFLYDVFHKNCPTSLSIGISDSWMPKEKLYQSYAKAKEAIEYIHFYQCDPVCLYSNLSKLKPSHSADIYNTKEAISLITRNEQEPLIAYFDNLYRQYCFPHTLMEGKTLLYFYYQLLIELKSFLCVKYPTIYRDFGEIPNEDILRMSLAEVTTLTKQYFINAQDRISSYKHNHMQFTVQHVRTYIDNNYFDVNMNQTSIANYFHITPAYLSQKFKDEYKISMVQYLYSVRIEHSLLHLKEKKLKISEIAVIVGFSNTNSYIRVFKQFMGVSPGKFIGEEYSDSK